MGIVGGNSYGRGLYVEGPLRMCFGNVTVEVPGKCKAANDALTCGISIVLLCSIFICNVFDVSVFAANYAALKCGFLFLYFILFCRIQF